MSKNLTALLVPALALTLFPFVGWAQMAETLPAASAFSQDQINDLINYVYHLGASGDWVTLAKLGFGTAVFVFFSFTKFTIPSVLKTFIESLNKNLKDSEAAKQAAKTKK